MIVVGGTYEERVVVPSSSDLLGSGMRAAALLRNANARSELVTAIDDDSREEAKYVAAALGVSFKSLRTRDEPVGFSYATPIAAPEVTGPHARLRGSTFRIDADNVLAFGMVEIPSGFKIRARTVVYDPQQPRDLEKLVLDNVQSDVLVLVANESETRQLGGTRDVFAASNAVLDRYPQVSVLVTKRGAAGSLVAERGRTPVPVGAHPTASVWPIGSGDAFSAGMAHGIEIGMDPVAAARVGSATAAFWCSTRSTNAPQTLLNGDSSQLPELLAPRAARIYVAGPFFTVAERWLVDVVARELGALGAVPWSPVDEVGPGGDEVAKKDLDGLLECDAVLALLDHNDPGTLFEVGWAIRHGIRVVGYGTNIDREGSKMLTGTDVELHSDLSTACYRAVWAGMGRDDFSRPR